MKQLWLLTGGNGSGKSTFYKTRLESHGLTFVNADQIARTLHGDPTTREISQQAQNLAREEFRERLARGENFCYETVFSHKEKLDWIRDALDAGYEVVLVYVHLANSSLNQARVYQRVLEGGHDVPPEKIKSRIPRTVENVRQALPIVTKAILYDNSSSEENPFHEIACTEMGSITSNVDPLPPWAKEMLRGLAR